MLILTRKAHESIFIGRKVRIELMDIDGDSVRLGIEAPRIIPVHRAEVFRKINLAQRAIFHEMKHESTQQPYINL